MAHYSAGEFITSNFRRLHDGEETSREELLAVSSEAVKVSELAARLSSLTRGPGGDLNGVKEWSAGLKSSSRLQKDPSLDLAVAGVIPIIEVSKGLGAAMSLVESSEKDSS